MAWSDAARAAAAEARRRMHTSLVSGIGGPNKHITRAALRGVAAKAIRHNRGVMKGVMKGAAANQFMYMTAKASVDLRKGQMVRAMSKLHPMYSRGMSPKKMGFSK